VDRLSDYVVDHVESFQSAKFAALLLRGFSLMQCTKRSLYNVLATVLSSRPIANRLTTQGISSAVKSFSSSKYVDLKLINSLRKQALGRDDLKAIEACDLACGFSRLALHDDVFYREMGDRVSASIAELPCSAVIGMLAAYTHIGVTHDRLLEAGMSSCLEKLPTLSPDEAATLLVTAWQMHYEGDIESLEKVADHIASNVEGLSSDSIGKLCVVLTDLSWRHGKLLAAIGTQAARLAAGDTLSPQTCRVVLDTLGNFLVNHSQARQALASSARTVSRDVIQASEQELDEIKRKAISGCR
jgi:hypothetical protein